MGDIYVSDWFQDQQISHILIMMVCLFVFPLQQVNGNFRPSSTDSTWGNLLPLCSFSRKTIKTEELTCPRETMRLQLPRLPPLLCNN